MRAMSHTLVIVVSVIVILVAALVVITIFGGGVQQVASIAQAKALCISQASASCAATGQMPPNWRAKSVRLPDGELVSCYEAVIRDGTQDCVCNHETRKLTGCVSK